MTYRGGRGLYVSSDRRKRTGRWGSCTETGRDRSGINLTVLMPRTRTITLTMLVNCSKTVDYMLANQLRIEVVFFRTF